MSLPDLAQYGGYIGLGVTILGYLWATVVFMLRLANLPSDVKSIRVDIDAMKKDMAGFKQDMEVVKGKVDDDQSDIKRLDNKIWKALAGDRNGSSGGRG